MSDKNPELDNELLKEIGRNLILFREIEKKLKILLPYLNSDNINNVKSFQENKEFFQSMTLGRLVKVFLKNVKFNELDFEESLEKMVAERNQLIHHLNIQNVISTEQECISYINYLKSQRKKALLFHEDLEMYVFSLLYFLRENYVGSHPKLELIYTQIKKDFLSKNIEYVNLHKPSETLWENTKIVKLLRLAEAELYKSKIDNLTLLSSAGQFIKAQNPECTPKKYGIKTLKGVLIISGLFEIFENQDDELNGKTVLYRSKVPHQQIFTENSQNELMPSRSLFIGH